MYERIVKTIFIRLNWEAEFYQVHPLPDYKPYLTTVRMMRFDLRTVKLRQFPQSDTECMTNIVKPLFIRIDWEI